MHRLINALMSESGEGISVSICFNDGENHKAHNGNAVE